MRAITTQERCIRQRRCQMALLELADACKKDAPADRQNEIASYFFEALNQINSAFVEWKLDVETLTERITRPSVEK